MISYAQNLEDVMLWRVLKDIKHGFYIDVGANDPSIDSVTRTFYENGWRGVNIEPLESHFRDLEQNRPRDVNLKCAAGAISGEIELWECDVRGWATAHRGVIDQYTKDGQKGVFRRVPVVPLTKICENYVSGQIHFLKIDVEGMEKDVVEGIDFSRFRPWVIIIEATRPNSTEEVHEEWEALISEAGYVFAYADGLNRFYLAEEKSERLRLFKYPPNIFDEYIRADLVALQQNVTAAEARAQQAEIHAQLSEARAQQSEARAQQSETSAQLAEHRSMELEQRLAAVENALHLWWLQATEWHERVLALHKSTSWKITKPLRIVKRIAVGDFSSFRKLDRVITVKVKQTLRPIISFGMRQVFKRPFLQLRLGSILRKIPWLHQRLYRVAMNTGAIFGLGQSGSLAPGAENRCALLFNGLNLQASSPRVMQIYADLRAAIEENKGRN